jgi:hypothetical protein
MKAPRCKKDLMKLTGCMAAMGRFISRSGCMAAVGRFISRFDDRGLPFFKFLQESNKFEWNNDASKAFQELKVLLNKPPC